MRKILLCTHGEFASGIKSSLEVITGNSDNVHDICVLAEDTMETVKSKIQDFVDRNKENDVVIMTDIVGGSPTQASFYIMSENENVSLLTGLNLALLLEIVLSAEEDTKSVIKNAMESAKTSVQFLNGALK